MAIDIKCLQCCKCFGSVENRVTYMYMCTYHLAARILVHIHAPQCGETQSLVKSSLQFVQHIT